MASKPTIFISYSHKDAKWKERLASHLGVLQIQDHLEFWTDDGIHIGDAWVQKIQAAITTANAAILLVSADFLNSPFIRRVEIAQLLARREKEGLPIFPILVRQCAWDFVPWLEQLQIRPRDAKPLAGNDDHQIDEHLTAIVKEIKGVLDRAAAVEPVPSSPSSSARVVQPSQFFVTQEWERDFVPSAPNVIVSPLPALPPTFRNSIDMDFVLIPAGEFRMGSQDGAHDEKPVHVVRITKPFYLGKYQVTQGQWQAVMGNNPSRFTGDSNRPVETVSWDDAQEFLGRLSKKEGPRYRLPTEAEWEYAARAGSTGMYCFGDDPQQLRDYAWYSENAEGTTHPVGQLKPNAWGLYDMHGNVWEWVSDWYDGSYYQKGPTDDPHGPEQGEAKVLRGGSWYVHPQVARASLRFRHAPGDRVVVSGLRCAQ
ncbi:MAG: SUMF1/EgtB/PvdO family nonheme iron enzyme [Deltaproteobacteria bacterium]|nr:SUMF1/EgtB/PvdO family nonheme iron enzyme [Deltaproteobacteria bacterium]